MSSMGSSNRRWLWYVVFLYVLTIYATLPLVRELMEAIYRSIGQRAVGLAVDTLVVLVGVGVVWLLVRARLTHTQRAVSLALFVIGGAVVFLLELPEEGIHFVEYGLLGFMAYLASSGWKMPFAVALTVVLLASTVDEAIQWALPTRVGDLKDIGLNLTGGIVGANLGWVYEKGR